MKVYITMTGRSDWAVLNSLWAAIKEKKYMPEKVYILAENGDIARAEKVKEGVATLLGKYVQNPRVIIVQTKTGDPIEARTKVTEIIDKEKENEIAVDITPGRKAVVTGALVAAAKKNIKHIFYLYIETLENASKPYVMIPKSIQHFNDFAEVKT